MTPSIQHYHGEVDISAIEVSLTHNCPHLTQAYFNLVFSRCNRLERFRDGPSAFNDVWGGRVYNTITFPNLYPAFSHHLAAALVKIIYFFIFTYLLYYIIFVLSTNFHLFFL